MTSESAFIDALRALATDPGARGFQDDAAVLDTGGDRLVLTKDMMAEGVHFPMGSAAEDVAWKLVSVNMSDLAAKGARPVAVLLGHSLGDAAWDAAFVAALGAALDHYGAALLGGDTIAMPQGHARCFSLTAIGRASSDPVPDRRGARAGDALYVTGTIGDAMMGFHAQELGEEGHPELVRAFRRPVARVADGIALAPHVHAMMDVSDGLLIDARRMAVASGLSVDIDLDAIPFSDAFYDAQPDQEHGRMDHFRAARLAAIGWGDDYQLLFAAPPGFVPPVAATRIGTFVGGLPRPLLLDGQAMADDTQLGYLHHGGQSAA